SCVTRRSPLDKCSRIRRRVGSASAPNVASRERELCLTMWLNNPGPTPFWQEKSLRACFKIERGPAARDFGRSQGGEARASPQRAVRAEPTPAAAKRPAALRAFAEKAAWLRCSSVTERCRLCSFVAPRQAAFSAKTGPL